jgi:uncharacterized protein (TIGR02145 family)
MKKQIAIKIFIWKICILFPLFLFSQGEFNNWYFGHHAGITFNNGAPVALTNCANAFQQNFATCTESDSLGNLLFYSDGSNVFNRNHTIMPNGHSLNPIGWWATQIVFCVPSLQDTNLFFLFTIDKYFTSGYPNPHGLRYSIIDMQLDGGLGDIESGQKNIPIPSAWDACENVTGTRHHNNKFAWVVTRKYYNSSYYASYLVSNTGLDTTAVLSNSLIPLNIDPLDSSNSNYSEIIKISPDGKKLLSTYLGSNGYSSGRIEVCNFNSQTGQVTPSFLIPVTILTERGFLEFSRDSKYVYVTEQPVNSQAHIVQFDATKTDSLSFIQSKVIIDSTYWPIGYQLGPDDKIYCATYSFYLDVINNPSVQGVGCNYQHNAVNLLGNLAIFGFPQLLQRYYVYIRHNGQCRGDPVNFSTVLFPPVDSLSWSFGDPFSGSLNYSDLPTPSHIFSSAGNYNVELIVRHNDKRMDTAWQVVTILPGPQPNLGPDQTICIGDSVTFDAGACTGCTYLWKNLGSGATMGTSQTFRTGQAGTYAAIVTGSNGCIGRDTVVLSTTPVPTVSNSPPLVKTICTGESTNIPLTSSPPGASFHWTASLSSGNVTGFSADSGLVINQVLTNPLATPGIVIYHITPKIGSCSGSKVDYQVTVNPGDSVKVSISASGNNICSGTLVTYTATPTYGGSSPSYQWKVNGVSAGTNSSLLTYTPVNNDVVSCILTSSNTICVFNNPATSNAITMIVNPQMPVSVSITSSLNPVCAGNTVLFTAHPINEGSSPVYQWKVNGVNAGTNSSTFTYIPVNNDQVNCLMTSSLTVCVTNNPATSNTIIMQVDQNHPVSLIISPSLNPVCAGNTVLFTALPVNPGLTPVYQWKVNGVNTGTNSSTFTYIPVNNDQVSCVLTSSLTSCVTNNPAMSNVMTMTVNPNYAVSVTISVPSDTVCQGTSVQLTAHPVNEGLTPVYQWKVNGVNTGANSPTFSYSPVDNDVVSCVLTSSYTACTTNNPATSNALSMTVINNLTAGVSITAVPNPFCSGNTVNYSATPTNGGFTPSYQWRVNGVNAGSNASIYSFVPLQGDIVQCVMNSSLSCITNNPVTSNTIVMNALAAPSVSFTLCFDSITTINAAAFKLKGGVPIGGVYSGPGVNSGTGVFTPSVAGVGTKTITYFYQNSFSCADSKTRTIIVQAAPSFTCGQNLTDIRDNKVYSTVQLGTQCWMQKNLNYGTSLQGTTEQTDNCINEKYCYSDNTANCTLYGGLYQWDELMAYTNTPGSQGLCSPGWHVPTQTEWNTLFTFYQQQALAGKPLQDTIIMGFRAKESGVIYSNFSWSFKGFATIFWTSTPSGTIKAMSHGMNLINFSVSDYPANRSNAFAVRCLHD